MAERYRPATPPRESIVNTFQRLEAAIKIDEYDLAVVCRDQPTLFHQVSREVAYSISRRDLAKQNLDRVEAQLILDYRGDAKRSETKMVADEVKASIKLDSAYLEAQEKLAKSNEVLLDWQALKDAYLQRSYALNHMVDLYLANYYGNIERRETGDMRSRNADEAKEGMRRLREAKGADYTKEGRQRANRNRGEDAS